MVDKPVSHTGETIRSSAVLQPETRGTSHGMFRPENFRGKISIRSPPENRISMIEDEDIWVFTDPARACSNCWGTPELDSSYRGRDGGDSSSN